MKMAAARTRGEVTASSPGRFFGLAFKADALWGGTARDGADGPAGRLAATEVWVTLIRVSQKTPVSGGDLRQFVAFWG